MPLLSFNLRIFFTSLSEASPRISGRDSGASFPLMRFS